MGGFWSRTPDQFQQTIVAHSSQARTMGWEAVERCVAVVEWVGLVKRDLRMQDLTMGNTLCVAAERGGEGTHNGRQVLEQDLRTQDLR